MRAVGTGKHPEGRFPEGQVCDLPEWPIGSGEPHPDYRSLLESGYLEALAEKDDPGRTPTQIANAVVRGDSLSHPVDAELAEQFTDEKALAVTHTSDPDADESMADPHETRGSTVGHRGKQLSAAPHGVQPWAEYDTEPDDGTGARTSKARRRGPRASSGSTGSDESETTTGDSGSSTDS